MHHRHAVTDARIQSACHVLTLSFPGDLMSVTAAASHNPLFFLLNACSGHKDADATRTIIERIIGAARRDYRIEMVRDPRKLVHAAHAIAQCARDAGGVVVVAGGDGTISTVAQAMLGSNCPLGVLPRGTFNYFSRTHGISEETEQAVRELLHARPVPVQAGLVNGRVFLVNASLGIYPQLLEDREAYKQRLGRSRLVAMLAGVMTALRQHRQLLLRIEYQGCVREVRTPTLFIGNNRLQFEQTGIPVANALDRGRLGAVMLKPAGTMTLLWLMLRGAFGKLGEADSVESFSFTKLTVLGPRGRRMRLKVALDGEVSRFDTPLEFSVSPQPLYLMLNMPSSEAASRRA